MSAQIAWPAELWQKEKTVGGWAVVKGMVWSGEPLISEEQSEAVFRKHGHDMGISRHSRWHIAYGVVLTNLTKYPATNRLFGRPAVRLFGISKIEIFWWFCSIDNHPTLKIAIFAQRNKPPVINILTNAE
jgi:hypothetical protein